MPPEERALTSVTDSPYLASAEIVLNAPVILNRRPHAVVAAVCSIAIAGRVHGDPGSFVQLGVGGGPIVPAEALGTVARNRSDHSLGDFEDRKALVVEVAP